MSNQLEINRFKCSIFDSIMAEVGRVFIMLVYLFIIYQFCPIYVTECFVIGWLIYIISIPVRLFFTNNNLLIREDEIVVQSTLLYGIRKKTFKIDKIKEIIFKEEWSEAYPATIQFLMFSLPVFWEYKWIKIINKDGSKFSYYFFGMNYDFYENANESLFEDMFIELAREDIAVRWKSVKDPYFKALQDTADKLRSK